MPTAPPTEHITATTATTATTAGRKPAWLARIEHQRDRLQLADDRVLEHLEDLPTEDLPGSTLGAVWRDTRPMLDEREHSSEVIDMHEQVLRYATERRLIVRCRSRLHLVRLLSPEERRTCR